MKICRCGHDEGAHANETGYCYGDKPNGDPCECERFNLNQAVPAIAVEDLEGSQYISQDERCIVEAGLIRAAAIGSLERGDLPDAVTMQILDRSRGPQKLIKFELILEIHSCEERCRRLYYHAAGPFEFAGIPGQAWTVIL